jgi:hypothetical protein
MATQRDPNRVPTLTEEVQVPPEAPDALMPARAEADLDDTAAPLTQAVLEDVQRQVDLMLEYRLRDAIAPALARASDGLIRELRHELAATLRDLVEKAVAQALARQRGR